MDVVGFCTADSYQIKPLYDYLRTQYKTQMIRDVIFVEPREGVEIFIFPYGCLVSWGLTKEESAKFSQKIKTYETGPSDFIDSDEFTFVQDEVVKVSDDEISLPSDDPFIKLAFSHGIAQSVELVYFESLIQKTFNKTREIPKDLAQRGRISLSRKEIRKKMGELFLERSSINLHADVLDLPEFFWDYPELEPYYQMIANYLDIRSRVEVLNHRLDITHELYEMLANELNHQHSSRLEWTIILLIIIEVVLSLLRDVFQVI